MSRSFFVGCGIMWGEKLPPSHQIQWWTHTASWLECLFMCYKSIWTRTCQLSHFGKSLVQQLCRSFLWSRFCDTPWYLVTLALITWVLTVVIIELGTPTRSSNALKICNKMICCLPFAVSETFCFFLDFQAPVWAECLISPFAKLLLLFLLCACTFFFRRKNYCKKPGSRSLFDFCPSIDTFNPVFS